jgi:hypothetical protein
MAQAFTDDLPDGQSEIFFSRGLDRHSADLPVGQISRSISPAQKGRTV